MSADPTTSPATPGDADQSGLDAPAAPGEEVDLWWGAFSGRTMARSFLVCVVLTGLIAWAGWAWVPRGWVKVTVLGASGVVWLVQLARWAARALGKNYRLTTRRLWVTHGIRRRAMSAVELAQVTGVTVERTWLERRLGVGRLCVTQHGGWPLILEGVAHPRDIAELIRKAVQEARAFSPP
jgi:hypothetical protein